MAGYRIICFDGAGKLWVDQTIVARSDQQAVAAARAVKNAVKCEVWQSKRLVASVEGGEAIYGESRPIM